MKSAPAETNRELPLSELRAFHEGLVAALAEAGQTAEQLHARFAADIRGECRQCGVAVTGAELAEALALGDAPAAATPRLARLAQGYCARKDCPSRFYQLAFAPVAGLDWPAVLERADALRAGRAQVARLAADAAAPPGRAARQKRLLQAAGLAAALLALWIGKRLWSGDPLPGFAPRPKYEIDPASLAPPLRP
jgi:hypothetical protein